MIQFHYFVNQSYIGYPHEAAADFGAVMLKFSNRHFNAEQAAALYDRYHREFVAAEDVGFDAVLVNEHHNAPILSPIPNISATVLAKITKRVKIFVGGNILPTNGNPLRLVQVPFSELHVPRTVHVPLASCALLQAPGQLRISAQAPDVNDRK